MPYPDRTFVYLAAVPALLSLGLFIDARVLPVLLGIDAAVLLLAAGDLLALPGRKHVRVRRRLPRTASLGQVHVVTLTVENAGKRRRVMELRDDVPATMVAEPATFLLRLPPRSQAECAYRLRPGERGAWTFEKVYGRTASPLGLWRRQLAWRVEDVVSVYPNLKQLSRYAPQARVNRLSLLGVRPTRRLGDDNEFERLRDHTAADDHRHIDWRATARRRKLTVRQYQATRSQRLVFLIDCGRMMVGRHGGVSLLDQALDAALMLSYVALSRGDQVGVLTFADRVLGYVPPRAGARQMERLIHEAHDRFPALVESRYDEAFLHIAHRCRKRALVVLITQLLDEVNAVEVERHLRHLSGRHLPLAILLRDPELFRLVEDESLRAAPGRLYPAAAAASILSWRGRVLNDLERRGSLVLDVAPERLTAAVINEYLRIKARHLL